MVVNKVGLMDSIKESHEQSQLLNNEEINMTAITYITYIIISICITIFISRTLSKNGQVYLDDGFNGNKALAKSVNQMLVVGFYLLNIGFVLLRLQTNTEVMDFESMIVYLSANIGLVLMVLGGCHFLNMALIHKFRASGMKRHDNKQPDIRKEMVDF